MYTLNGLGDMGSIAYGKPSPERSVLVRREALELALYSFHYIDGLDMVVALLPPSSKDVKKARDGDTTPTLTAMLLRPEELRDRLAIPLTATIPPRTPKVKELTEDNPETKVVSALTTPNVFTVTFQQAQDAKTYLVLRALSSPDAPSPPGCARSCVHQKLDPHGARLGLLHVPEGADGPALREVPAAAGDRLPRVRAGARSGDGPGAPAPRGAP